jgi:hypothetical protein
MNIKMGGIKHEKGRIGCRIGGYMLFGNGIIPCNGSRNSAGEHHQ